MDLLSTIWGMVTGLFDLVSKVVGWRVQRKKEKAEEDRQRSGFELLARFLSIFESRGVPRPLIPKFAGLEGQITIQQACSNELLVALLDDAVLQNVAKRFAISSAWLYGASTQRFVSDTSYKEPGKALSRLIAHLTGYQEAGGLWDELIFVADGPVPEGKSDNSNANVQLVILYRALLDNVEGIDLDRVEVFEADIPWSHEPARLYAKEVALLAMLLGIHVRGMIRDQKIFAAFYEDKLFPHQLIRSGAGWHPDDYVLLRENSVVAKQRNEAKIVRSRIDPELVARAIENCGKFGRRSWDKRIDSS